MANRRMISKDIVNSDIFMSMSKQAQYLYFQLFVRADDDGLVKNIKAFISYIGVELSALQELERNRFIIVFDSGVWVIRSFNTYSRITRG